jgi:hypothetical protein
MRCMVEESSHLQSCAGLGARAMGWPWMPGDINMQRAIWCILQFRADVMLHAGHT